MSTQMSPFDECPFDVWGDEVWAQVGDYDAQGPFAGRDDDCTPF
jgi:hypothetical protein